jgi:hypothetical protein
MKNSSDTMDNRTRELRCIPQWLNQLHYQVAPCGLTVDGRMDEGTVGQTHMMKLTVASRSSANTPKNVKKINAQYYSDLFLKQITCRIKWHFDAGGSRYGKVQTFCFSWPIHAVKILLNFNTKLWMCSIST